MKKGIIVLCILTFVAGLAVAPPDASALSCFIISPYVAEINQDNTAIINMQGDVSNSSDLDDLAAQVQLYINDEFAGEPLSEQEERMSQRLHENLSKEFELRPGDIVLLGGPVGGGGCAGSGVFVIFSSEGALRYARISIYGEFTYGDNTFGAHPGEAYLPSDWGEREGNPVKADFVVNGEEFTLSHQEFYAFSDGDIGFVSLERASTGVPPWNIGDQPIYVVGIGDVPIPDDQYVQVNPEVNQESVEEADEPRMSFFGRIGGFFKNIFRWISDLFTPGSAEPEPTPTPEPTAFPTIIDSAAKELPSPTPLPLIHPDWKRFESEGSGLSLQYPPQYKLVIDDVNKQGIIAFESDDGAWGVGVNVSFSHFGSAHDLPQNLDDWGTIAGVPAFGEMWRDDERTEVRVHFKKGKFTFGVDMSVPKEHEEAEVGIFREILSTIRVDLPEDLWGKRFSRPYPIAWRAGERGEQQVFLSETTVGYRRYSPGTYTAFERGGFQEEELYTVALTFGIFAEEDGSLAPLVYRVEDGGVERRADVRLLGGATSDFSVNAGTSHEMLLYFIVPDDSKEFYFRAEGAEKPFFIVRLDYDDMSVEWIDELPFKSAPTSVIPREIPKIEVSEPDHVDVYYASEQLSCGGNTYIRAIEHWVDNGDPLGIFTVFYEDEQSVDSIVYMEEVDLSGGGNVHQKPFYHLLGAPQTCDRIFMTRTGDDGLYVLDLFEKKISAVLGDTEAFYSLVPVNKRVFMAPSPKGFAYVTREARGESECHVRTIDYLDLEAGTVRTILRLPDSQSLSSALNAENGECPLDITWIGDSSIKYKAYDIHSNPPRLIGESSVDIGDMPAYVLENVVVKYLAYKDEYSGGIGAAISECTKDGATTYVVSGSTGFVGSYVYFDDRGREMGVERWTDYGMSEKRGRQIDRSAYDCRDIKDTPEVRDVMRHLGHIAESPESTPPLPTPTGVITVPNPAAALERDAARIEHLTKMRDALNVYMAIAIDPIVLCDDDTLYVSADIAPSHPWLVQTGATAVDGSGWIPVDFRKTPGGPPIDTFSKDPLNDAPGRFIYVYACSQRNKTFELNANMETTHYSSGGAQDTESTDGGDRSDIFEVGNDRGLDLIPSWVWPADMAGSRYDVTPAPTPVPTEPPSPTPEPAPDLSYELERDKKRITDLANLRNALNLYLTTVTAPHLCEPGVLYASADIEVPGMTVRTAGTAVDGTGWIPVDLTQTAGGSVLSSLRVDPLNAGEYVYTYACDPTQFTYELNANMETERYGSGGVEDIESTDGGDDASVYEVGNDPGFDLIGPHISAEGANERDARRVSEMRDIQNALEVYFVRFGSHPDDAGGYAGLQGTIATELMSHLPNDPLCPEGACPADNTHTDYRYAADANNLSYVLGAELENTAHTALTADPDEVIHGIDCADPIYCVQF